MNSRGDQHVRVAGAQSGHVHGRLVEQPHRGDLPAARDQGLGDAALIELLQRSRVHHERSGEFGAVLAPLHHGDRDARHSQIPGQQQSARPGTHHDDSGV